MFTRPKNWALRSTPDFSKIFVKRQKEKTRGEIRGQNLRAIETARLPCDQRQRIPPDSFGILREYRLTRGDVSPPSPIVLAAP